MVPIVVAYHHIVDLFQSCLACDREECGSRKARRVGWRRRAVSALGPRCIAVRDIYLIDHHAMPAAGDPNGKSLLFDASQPGEPYVNRILSIARQAGLKQIDYVVISHYDWDHYGAVPALSEKLPILNYVDHGATSVRSRRRTAGPRQGRPWHR